MLLLLLHILNAVELIILRVTMPIIMMRHENNEKWHPTVHLVPFWKQIHQRYYLDRAKIKDYVLNGIPMHNAANESPQPSANGIFYNLDRTKNILPKFELTHVRVKAQSGPKLLEIILSYSIALCNTFTKYN
jgi:hypothetical protein